MICSMTYTHVRAYLYTHARASASIRPSTPTQTKHTTHHLQHTVPRQRPRPAGGGPRGAHAAWPHLLPVAWPLAPRVLLLAGYICVLICVCVGVSVSVDVVSSRAIPNPTKIPSFMGVYFKTNSPPAGHASRRRARAPAGWRPSRTSSWNSQGRGKGWRRRRCVGIVVVGRLIGYGRLSCASLAAQRLWVLHPYTNKHQQTKQQGPTFEEMLAAVLPLYKALLKAIAALGFSCVVYFFCIYYVYI